MYGYCCHILRQLRKTLTYRLRMHGHAQSWGQLYDPGACAVTTWTSCCYQTVVSHILLWLVRDFSFVSFRFHWLTMSTDAPTDSRADVATGGSVEGDGSRKPTPFSPEQIVVIDRLIAARVAAASDPRAATMASLPSGYSSTTGK